MVYVKTSEQGDKKVIWDSKSANTEQSPSHVALSDKGEVVITDELSNKVLYTSESKAVGSGFFLIIQNDGNLCVYNSAFEN